MKASKLLGGLAAMTSAVALYLTPAQAQTNSVVEQIRGSPKKSILEQYESENPSKRTREEKFAKKLDLQYEQLQANFRRHIYDNFLSDNEMGVIRGECNNLSAYFDKRRFLLTDENRGRYTQMIENVRELRDIINNQLGERDNKLEQMLSGIRVGGWSGESTATFVACLSTLTFSFVVSLLIIKYKD